MDFLPIGSRPASLLSKVQHASQNEDHIHSPPSIDRIIDHVSGRYDVEPSLIRAVIRAESDFDSNCTSSKGAMGLMQLMPETAQELGVKNPYNPVENIMGGTRYLKSLLDRYDGNIPLALAAYNWGMGNVERHPNRLPQETRAYIARVNEYYRNAKS
jgi:soluble lytic murein transglycosylase-like protein